MQTYSGGQFFYDPDDGQSTISLVDIARSLSRIIRFYGHAAAPISVAEHCCVVMEIVANEGGTPRQQLYALLHDAHEAYTGDISRPLKHLLMDRYRVDIRSLERGIQERIYQALNIPLPEPAEMALIEKADLYALAAERSRWLPSAHAWHTDGVAIPAYVEGCYGIWGEDEAFRYFEKNFERLYATVSFEARIEASRG